MTLLTVKDVAAWLQVKEKTVYAWVSQRRIPCVKINRAIRFDERELEQWLQTCHVQIGPTCVPTTSRRNKSFTDVDHLIEGAKRAVYTAHGETKPIASPFGKERMNGTL